MGKRSTIPTTGAEAAALTVSESNQQTALAKHQSWPMVKPALFAALVCAAPVCRSSAQEAKIAIDMMGIGGMSCAHWQSPCGPLILTLIRGRCACGPKGEKRPAAA